MPIINRTKTWHPRVHRWLTYVLVFSVVTLSVIAFTLISMSSNSSRLNARQVFESSRWNALQLQLQTYRLLDYVSELSNQDMPLNGDGYFQYDLVMSRIDLLRQGEIGNHIRNFSNGRAVRLLNIITGELELISLNIEHLEQGQLDQIPIIVQRLRSLDSQITDFVVIVNQGANNYVTEQRTLLKNQLNKTQNVALGLLAAMLLLVLVALKVLREQRIIFTRNKNLEARVKAVQDEKTEVIARIANELRPSITSMVGLSSGAHIDSDIGALTKRLRTTADMSSHLLTQIDSYQDLTQIESNQLVLNLSSAKLSTHIEDTLSTLSNVFHSHHVRVINTIDSSLSTFLVFDYDRLNEVLTNLITQIIPYAQRSSLVLHTRPSTLPTADFPSNQGGLPQKMVQITVRDGGTGLPSSVQSGLRLNPHNPINTISKQIHEIGVGLTLCHRLIVAMGGELHFSSSAESGTEIWINIPMGVNTSSKAVKAPVPADKCIAILDSDPLFSRALVQALEPYYQNVISVTQTQLQDYTSDQDTVDFEQLIIMDKNQLDPGTRSALGPLTQRGVTLIASIDVADQFTDIDAHHILDYPITQTQLQQFSTQ